MAPPRCPVCGAANATCGPAGLEPSVHVMTSATFGRRPRSEEPVGLKLYDVTQNGRTVRLRLNETDAQAYGAAAVVYTPPTIREIGHADDAHDRAKKAPAPANKARTAEHDKS